MATGRIPVIVCDEPQFEDSVFVTLLKPRVVVEVLSEATEKYDPGAKFGHYRTIPSVQENVLVSQDRPLIERYVRRDDASWVLTVFNDLAQTFAFTSVDVRIPLAEIYRGVVFPETSSR